MLPWWSGQSSTWGDGREGKLPYQCWVHTDRQTAASCELASTGPVCGEILPKGVNFMPWVTNHTSWVYYRIFHINGYGCVKRTEKGLTKPNPFWNTPDNLHQKAPHYINFNQINRVSFYYHKHLDKLEPVSGIRPNFQHLIKKDNVGKCVTGDWFPYCRRVVHKKSWPRLSHKCHKAFSDMWFWWDFKTKPILQADWKPSRHMRKTG